MTKQDQAAAEFIRRHVEVVRDLYRTANELSWRAATTGSEDALRDSAAARTEIRLVYSNREELEQINDLLRSGRVEDPLLKRQLVLLAHAYVGNQLTAEVLRDLTQRESELEQIFYNFRAEWEGTPQSNNDLRERLKQELDSEKRRRIWEASKEIGVEVAPRLLDLVRRRNEAARGLGFANFYAMEMALQEIDEHELFELLEDFHSRSDAAFTELRQAIDAEMAERFGVDAAQLRPWHWDDFFAQEAPHSEKIDLDPHFARLDQEAFVRDYFARIGLPVDEILPASDLYEREGKDQNAFCIDIDREGDVRVLVNLRRDEHWMHVLLHELGHAVYDKYVPHSLPYLLRCPAHMLSTEAIAMYFGRLTRNPAWLREFVTGDLPEESSVEVFEQQRTSMLVAARWIMVMVYFEREMYRDPERADLNRLWWDLVERFQLVRRPDGRDSPDWAAKIHLSLAPVYYHNYLLGELMASQLTSAMRVQGIGADEVGGWLKDRLFEHGASLHWNDLMREVTGEPLSARHFVEQFIGEAAGI